MEINNLSMLRLRIKPFTIRKRQDLNQFDGKVHPRRHQNRAPKKRSYFTFINKESPPVFSPYSLRSGEIIQLPRLPFPPTKKRSEVSGAFFYYLDYVFLFIPERGDHLGIVFDLLTDPIIIIF